MFFMSFLHARRSLIEAPKISEARQAQAMQRQRGRNRQKQTGNSAGPLSTYIYVGFIDSDLPETQNLTTFGRAVNKQIRRMFSPPEGSGAGVVMHDVGGMSAAD
jgi:hypothetical protein